MNIFWKLHANLHETYIQFYWGSFYVEHKVFCWETHKLSVSAAISLCWVRIHCNFISILAQIQFSDRLNDILIQEREQKKWNELPSLNLPFIRLISVRMHQIIVHFAFVALVSWEWIKKGIDSVWVRMLQCTLETNFQL